MILYSILLLIVDLTPPYTLPVLFTQAPILVWLDGTIIDIIFSTILVTMYYSSGYLCWVTIDGCVCVCVLCFLPIYSGHQVRWTYQPGSRRRKVTQDFSSTFLLRCVLSFLSREGFSHSFPSSTVKSNFVYKRFNLVLHSLGIFIFCFNLFYF